MPLPETLFVQEIDNTLYVNKTVEGASGHNVRGQQRIGVYKLQKEVRIVSTVEDIPAAEKAAAAPQH
jgi:hypothetical protein